MGFDEAVDFNVGKSGVAGVPGTNSGIFAPYGTSDYTRATRDTGVKASGKTEILTLTPDQKAQMKKALVNVHKENESRVGKETIAEVYKETGFKP